MKSRLIGVLLAAFIILAPAAHGAMSEVEFDLLSAKVANALKKGEFEKALPMISQIKNSGRQFTPSLLYFEGFAFQNLGRLQEAEAAYRTYLETAGKSGAYYNKALGRIIEIQEQMEAVAAKEAEAAAAQARAAVEAKRKAAEAARRAEAAKTQGGYKFKDCDVCPEMVNVPAGRFVMGSSDNEDDRSDSEGPQRTVNIPKVFAIGVYEVTRREFAAFLNRTGYRPSLPCKTYKEAALDLFSGWEELPNWPDAGHAQSPSHPAVCADISDAKAYVKWLTEVTGKTYRLPSEAEWEYAARAGTRTRYFYGNDRNYKQVCRHGNTAGETGGCTDDGYRGIPAPVGKYRPNGFGLHDMVGNVAEWVQDCYSGSYAGAPTDGSARTSGEACYGNVIRGGSYFWSAIVARSAARLSWGQDHSVEFIGFRVVREVN